MTKPDPYSDARSSLIFKATLFIVISGVLFLPVHIFYIRGAMRVNVGIILSVLVACLGMYLTKRGYSRAGGMAVVLTVTSSLFFVFTKNVQYLGGATGFALVIPVVLSGLVVGSRWMWWYALLTAAFLPVRILMAGVQIDKFQIPVLMIIIVLVALIVSKIIEQFEIANLELGLQRDILETKVQERTSELVEAKQLAEEANRLKSQFLANMSHELRTPLNSIINFTDRVLQDESLPARHRQRLSRVYANGDHLLGLINDILDLSKIESGRMELFQEWVDVPPLFHGVLSTAIGLTKDRQEIELRLDLADDVPPRLFLDKTRIRQVLLNLLSNAAKFTPAGSIVVGARLQDNVVVVSVKDTGIGIAPEHHQLIFEEFRQVDSNLQRQYTGTGLGLPLCRKLVSLHGGRMWLESEAGYGATFYFTIPVPEDFQAPAEQRARAATEEARRIVVVDHDRAALETVSAIVNGVGQSVVPIYDSRDALAIITGLQPAPVLVLLEILMPHVDGWELLSRLKSHPQTSQLPVVFCSSSDAKNLATALGVSDYLLKPIQRDELLAIVRRYVPISTH